jgi:hypothetical protein
MPSCFLSSKYANTDLLILMSSGVPLQRFTGARSMGSCSKKFFQMKRFNAGADDGGLGWLLLAEPVIEVQPW